MKRMLKVTGLVLAAVVLGLLSVQGSLALWNTTANSKAQNMSTADFSVSVKSDSGPTAYLAEGTTAVDLASQNPLKPGESNTLAIRVGNATNASSGTFRTRLAPGTPVVGGALKNHLTLSLTKAQGSDCSKTVSVTSIDLAQDESALFCLQTTLAPAAPATLSGAKGTISLPLSATQL
ncbi:hypothetical protein [Paeniglutamicibacter gangotriensis]|uniref:Camelysin metallo-endopeptidase n=1 Tax=Paeniglutamicibacter gangotriensis Lz1y TaxID=1276920 RepID=M7NF11_9MICC|nr:hypothetical protein [Paeniglutamicibacter gangotriensis]EMR00405.1 hypothetical protein ADIAG_00412 [Paeniglutamicibacter gangotriensis Lz1y]